MIIHQEPFTPVKTVAMRRSIISVLPLGSFQKLRVNSVAVPSTSSYSSPSRSV